jgi:SAM-dependent methyltransferase
VSRDQRDANDQAQTQDAPVPAESGRTDLTHEADRVRERYAARSDREEISALYDPLLPSVYLAVQEKERALVRWIKLAGIAPVHERRVLEVGCGGGGNLLQLIQLGFRPENLIGNELLEERAKSARHRLPEATDVIEGDATQIDIAPQSQDVVYQSTVFTSLLDDAFQQTLADRMWSWVRPGGGVLWYDFIYDNPRNPDVRGVPLDRVRALFPHGEVSAQKLTLAAPISRRVTRIHPSLYGLFNMTPILRTHVLCWIRKP